jgi:hypothetical protein
MSKYMDTKTGSLEESILGIWTEAAKKQQSETNKNNKSDDGDGMDAVQPKAVKKKFKDRKDKDIDNDGDVDSSDKYLHKRRKAVSKAIKDEGNAFGKALKDAKEKGEKTFVVSGKKYNVKEEVELKEIKKVRFEFKDKNKMMKAVKDLEKQGHKVEKGKMSLTVTAKRGSDLNRQATDIVNFYGARAKALESVGENFEVGTKERRDHTLKTTPGQSPEEFDKQVGVMQAKNNYMREALAKMWGIEEGKNVFEKNPKKEEKKVKAEKTMTGKKTTEVKVDPDLDK